VVGEDTALYVAGYGGSDRVTFALMAGLNDTGGGEPSRELTCACAKTRAPA
jgi:hypothetical protein